MKEKQAALQSRVESEKEKIANLQEKHAQLDESRQALEDAQTNNNLQKAAELRYIEQFLNWKKNLEN